MAEEKLKRRQNDRFMSLCLRLFGDGEKEMNREGGKEQKSGPEFTKTIKSK